MDLNQKPHTLVETFDRANYNSIPEYNVALITLLTYPVSKCTTESSFSGMRRLQTPLRRTMTDESELYCKSKHTQAQGRNNIDIDGTITEFARLNFHGVNVLPFFAVKQSVPYR